MRPLIFAGTDEPPTGGWTFGRYVAFEIAKAVAVAVATEASRWVFEEVRALRRKSPKTP